MAVVKLTTIAVDTESSVGKVKQHQRYLREQDDLLLLITLITANSKPRAQILRKACHDDQ
jgi:hypothetical protein